MKNKTVLFFIKELERPIFTTNEIANMSRKSLSNVTQSLAYLEQQKIISKIYRGIWIETKNKNISPYSIINFLLPFHKVYVSFISALHLYGIIEQIPNVITLASSSHTKIIKTKIATYSIHHLSPLFFTGFNWYKNEGNFLIAEPEKALIDCLYLSAYKKKQYRYFPELHFPKSFRITIARNFIKKIQNKKIKKYVEKKFDRLF